MGTPPWLVGWLTAFAASLLMMATDDPPPASEAPLRPLLRFDKLRIAGFKSFVDPVDVLIEPGLTGIVGPNGCGKSNLIEALRWVMGESSARQMRGGEMDDVIFNGTATRPARDVAEVVIELGNAARAAPPPFNGFETLEISRRIGRARGSMYRVNGKEVRARDVQLLLADSATGARSTAIVSQGQVGGLIAAKPQERRVILEEAAGITGLHSRRHEADMRLRSAEVNLERLEDVVATLEAQLQGLRKQARQAGRYRVLSEQIRAAEILLYKLRWRADCEALSQARNRVADAEVAADGASLAAATASARQAKAAAALPRLRRLDADTAADLQRLTMAQDGLDAEDHRVAADRHACRLRLDQAAADLQRERTLIAEADAALSHLAVEKARIEALREGEAVAQAAASAELAAVDAEVERLDAAVGALTAALASAEADHSAIQRRVKDLEARSGRLAARAADLTIQLSSLERQRHGSSDTDATSEALAAASAELEIARTAAVAADGQQDAAVTAAADALAAHQVAATEHGRLQAEEKALVQVLALDGPAAGTPVVDMLSARPDLEVAVVAALGDDLLAPLEALASRYWRTLPPLEAAPPLPPGIPSLANLLSAPAILERRFSQIGVVADDGEGERLQAALSPGQRLVTREGAQWRWDGLTVTPGGSPPAARLRQRNRLIEVRKRGADAAATLDMAAERLEKARARAREAADAHRRAQAAVRSSEAVHARARDTHSEARDRLARAAAQLDATEANLRAVQNEQTENDSALTAALAELADLPDSATARDQLTVLRCQLAEKRALQSGRRLAQDAMMREVEGRRYRLEEIEGDAGSWRARREAAYRQLTVLEARHAATEAELDRLNSLPAIIATKRDALLNEIETAVNARRAASDELAAGEAALAEADRDARAAACALIGAREDRVRAEAAAEQAEAAHRLLAARIAEAFGLDPQRLDAAVVDGEGQAAAPDPDAVERRLERMRRDRDMIGPVNLCADQEATELAGRIKALVAERLDLLAAIARLRQGLAELDREGRERLMASFADIDRHFRELFVRLFGGGRAHLALTESDDPLDAGLEIMASPPGKRLQSLSLLSGGEQALATLALVFAVFLSTPTPICVLDEVDAPLDDANVDRLCTLLSELTTRSGTRFLIITHHRMTMARMDRLFGVTMAEKGVSQLVSVDLVGANRLRQSA